jgi:hypothetical protein
MNHQPMRVLSRLAISWGILKTSIYLTSIALTAFTLASCGGSADETIVTSNSNTPLLLSNFSGLKGYTVGTSQVYSVNVKDPDGISSVSVKLDGENIPVSVAGDVYSVNLPASITVGTHSVIFTARGKGADGTLEVPVSEGVNFTVFKNNTPLSIGAVQGFAAYTLGAPQTYFTDVVDPDGINSVSATFNGQPIAVTALANRYSVTIPATATAGNNTLRFEGVGKQPDTSNEAAQSAQIAFIIYPNNTSLVTGSISGVTTYTVGGSQTYSLSPVDPDGITSVTATLDGTNIALSVTGNTYRFSTPANLSLGNHAISFSATGKQPNGAAETAVVISQNITVLATNTALNLGAITGPATYTVGTAQPYSVTATDPDGIVSVSATLDSSPISVVPSNGTYSVTLPTTVVTGTRTIQFSAIGRQPDGSSETAVTVSRQIQVLPTNSTLSLSSITGLASYVVGASPSYTATVVDPDGINSVSATLDGSPIGTSNNGSTYSVTVPSTLALGQHTLVIRAQGTIPGGGLETQQTTSVTFTVLAANTQLSLSAISGAATIPLNSIGTYSVTVTDPDGISSVSATIDGSNANVTNNGSSYSVQTPSYQVAGSHTVVFTATGQIPGGGTETAQQVTRSFSVQTPNTVINISAISGPTNFTVGQTIPAQYTFNVVDPDGVVSVSATLNGQFISTANLGNGTYGVTVPSSTPQGLYTLSVGAVGTVPGVGTENATPQTTTFRSLPPNTLLNMSAITTQFIPVTSGNGTDQWSIVITEPDGAPTVEAFVNGQNVVFFKTGNTYTFSTPSTQSLPAISFTAIGVNPDGSAEVQQTRIYTPLLPN